MESVPLLKHARETRGSKGCGGAVPGICQGEDDGQCGLHREINREDCLLEGRKLWAGKSTVCHDATYEGLKDLRAKEGAIAGESVFVRDCSVVNRKGLTLSSGRGQGI